MNITELEKLSESEMSQIKGGGGYWVWVDNQWFWIEAMDLGDEDTPPPPPPNM